MKIIRHPKSTEYCGCCGRECIGEWCRDCKEHLGPAHLPPWDRIYFALHNEDCPYQRPEKRP
jgi:hypothetical protein